MGSAKEDFLKREHPRVPSFPYLHDPVSLAGKGARTNNPFKDRGNFAKKKPWGSGGRLNENVNSYGHAQDY